MNFARTAAFLSLAAIPALWAQTPQSPDPPRPAPNAVSGTAPDKAAAPAPPSLPKTPSPAEQMRQSIEKQRAAIEKQREAVRQQAESAGAWMKPGEHISTSEIPSPGAAVEAECDPLGNSVIDPLIETNAKTQQVKPELLRAVMERESGYRPCAVSRKGAQGLMQLMPTTAQDFGVTDVFDPKQNVAAGAKLLKQLFDKYNGDLPKALAAYNAGATTVDQAGGVPDIQETKDYVDAILKKLAPKSDSPAKIEMPKAPDPPVNR